MHNLIRAVGNFADAKGEFGIDGVAQGFDNFAEGFCAAGTEIEKAGGVGFGDGPDRVGGVGAEEVIPLLLAGGEGRFFAGEEFADEVGNHPRQIFEWAEG